MLGGKCSGLGLGEFRILNCFLLPTAYCLLPAAYCLLPSDSCSSLVTAP